MINSNLFKEPLATNLELSRDICRKHGRITYDCFNCICKGDRAECNKSHVLAKSKGMLLKSVLKGVSGVSCKTCQEYKD